MSWSEDEVRRLAEPLVVEALHGFSRTKGLSISYAGGRVVVSAYQSLPLGSVFVRFERVFSRAGWLCERVSSGGGLTGFVFTPPKRSSRPALRIVR